MSCGIGMSLAGGVHACGLRGWPRGTPHAPLPHPRAQPQCRRWARHRRCWCCGNPSRHRRRGRHRRPRRRGCHYHPRRRRPTAAASAPRGAAPRCQRTPAAPAPHAARPRPRPTCHHARPRSAPPRLWIRAHRGGRRHAMAHGVVQEPRRMPRVPLVRNPQRSEPSGTRHPKPQQHLCLIWRRANVRHSGTTLVNQPD